MGYHGPMKAMTITRDDGPRRRLAGVAVTGIAVAIGLLAACAFEAGPAGGLLELSPVASQGEYVDRIVVSWPSVGGAEAYRVYACDVDVGLYLEAGDGAIDRTSFEYGAALPYFVYFFRVSAIEGGVETPLSRSCVGWVAPGSPSVAAVGSGLELSWDGVPGVEQYLLELALSEDGPFYPMNPTDSSLVVDDPEHPYDASRSSFRFDPAEERHSIALRKPGTDVWFRIRALSVGAPEGDLRSRGAVVGWSAP